MENYIYVVSEESHGDVSWWTDRDAAYSEAKRISVDGWGEDELVTIDDISDADVDNGEYCVYIRTERLNTPWGDYVEEEDEEA